MQKWREEILKLLVFEYATVDVFNVDEIALCFKNLTESTIGLKEINASKLKSTKQILTFLTAANMHG